MQKVKGLDKTFPPKKSEQDIRIKFNFCQIKLDFATELDSATRRKGQSSKQSGTKSLADGEYSGKYLEISNSQVLQQIALQKSLPWPIFKEMIMTTF